MLSRFSIFTAQISYHNTQVRPQCTESFTLPTQVISVHVFKALPGWSDLTEAHDDMVWKYEHAQVSCSDIMNRN